MAPFEADGLDGSRRWDQGLAVMARRRDPALCSMMAFANPVSLDLPRRQSIILKRLAFKVDAGHRASTLVHARP